MPPLTCRQLRAGDLLLKLDAGSPVNRIIHASQSLFGMEFPTVVHAGVLFDPFYIIEASKVGVHGNDLRVGNRAFEYIVYRCTDAGVAAGAGTYAKILFDIHARSHAVPYSLFGAIRSLVGGTGSAATPAEMDQRLESVLQGVANPNFCSQFVVAVFQFAAEQNGRAASTVFDAIDAVPPSRLASMLVRSQAFEPVGYMEKGVR